MKSSAVRNIIQKCLSGTCTSLWKSRFNVKFFIHSTYRQVAQDIPLQLTPLGGKTCCIAIPLGRCTCFTLPRNAHTIHTPILRVMSFSRGGGGFPATKRRGDAKAATEPGQGGNDGGHARGIKRKRGNSEGAHARDRARRCEHQRECALHLSSAPEEPPRGSTSVCHTRNVFFFFFFSTCASAVSWPLCSRGLCAATWVYIPSIHTSSLLCVEYCGIVVLFTYILVNVLVELNTLHSISLNPIISTNTLGHQRSF